MMLDRARQLHEAWLRAATRGWAFVRGPTVLASHSTRRDS